MNRPPSDSHPNSRAASWSRQTETASPEETGATGEASARATLDEKKNTRVPYNPRFVAFFKLLSKITSADETTPLFPKKCRVCATEFRGFPEYLRATKPKGHVFEDCKEVMNKPFTMVYRHCTCGNTLVLTLTDKIFPPLDDMWAMLNREAAESALPLAVVVEEFSRQCDQYVLEGDASRAPGAKP